MDERICYVVGAGEFVGPPPTADDFVIAADGGFAHLRALGAQADLVLGDFDSLGAPPAHPHLLRLPREKDDTDMLAALREGLARGFRAFHLHGGTGGRIEHTLANLQCLAFLAGQGAHGYLFGRDRVMTLLAGGALRFDAACRGFISAFSYSDACAGVCERGLKYTLEDAALTSSFPVGVSNEFVGEPACVSVQQGLLLLVWERQAHGLGAQRVPDCGK